MVERIWLSMCKAAISRHKVISLGLDWPAHEAMIVAVYGRPTYEKAMKAWAGF